MSWVEKLDSGRYRGVYRDEAGRRRSRTFERRALAISWLAAEATDRARGQWVDPRDGAVPLDAWAAQWFAVRKVRPTTAASDQSRYDTHLGPALGEVFIRDITPLRVKGLIAAGVPVKAIQERLGHASIVMTMDRYGYLLPSVDATVLRAVDAGLGSALECCAGFRRP